MLRNDLLAGEAPSVILQLNVYIPVKTF